jgi:uncharacterized protein (TIRG00374 family)
MGKDGVQGWPSAPASLFGRETVKLADLRGKLILSCAFGLAVLVALGLYADWGKVTSTLGGFRWEYLPLILGLTLFNYALRFMKWHYYLGQVGVRSIRLGDSAAIFVSGMTMVMTPGKVGELLKSVLLKQVSGTPISISAPIVVAERLTDGLAMLLLASGGVILYRQAVPLVLTIAAGGLLVVGISQQRTLARRLLHEGRRLPLLASFVGHLQAFYESTYQLLRWQNVALAVSIGVISWAGECLALYVILVGLGLAGTTELAIQSAFILAVSTLVGSVSMLPGGLGIADGSVTGLLQLVVGMGAEQAVTATILIRFCTLWFGVTLGIITLILYRQRLAGIPQEMNHDG